MFKLLLAFVVLTITRGQFMRPLIFRPFPHIIRPFPNYNLDQDFREAPLQLCTYTDIDYNKCIHTVEVAKNSSIPLDLECVRKDKREDCIQSVELGTSDMVVLTGHGYQEARRHDLTPMIFAKEDEQSLYIAVAPRNITLIGLQETPIFVDQSNHRAFHAATFFNSRMGHDICAFATKAFLGPYINIVDSAYYVPNSEEILICPNRLPAEFEDYKQCNVEAGLQRAVFVRSGVTRKQQDGVRKIFDTIFQRFGPTSQTTGIENDNSFNFFNTFQGEDNVIFKNNTISFDFQPTYRNAVDEKVFNHLHCNQEEQPHDSRVLS